MVHNLTTAERKAVTSEDVPPEVVPENIAKVLRALMKTGHASQMAEALLALEPMIDKLLEEQEAER